METAASHNANLTGRVEMDNGPLGLRETIEALRGVRSRAGYANFDAAVKALNRERVDPTREKRKRFSKAVCQRLFDRQGGKCLMCRETLDIPAYQNEVDHIDPNRADFNHPSNLRLLHRSCNREKSSASVIDHAKRTGQTIREMIDPNED